MMTHTIHAIVPMKPLARAKSRLAHRLNPAQRRALATSLLQHTLDIVCAAAQPAPNTAQGDTPVQAVWVVSSDQEVLDLAARYGAQPLYDPATTMNAALDVARAAILQTNADALLVIPADLPLLTRDDITHLTRLLAVTPRPACVLAPNRDHSGTNALGLSLPTPMPFLFGNDSFARHQGTAHVLALNVQIYTSSTLALDIDQPEDLTLLEQIQTLERNQRYDTHWLCCGT
jgi:2-phospho-L-lactate guanylyltransferase